LQSKHRPRRHGLVGTKHRRIGLGLNHVAELFDQLIIAGVLAAGIVYCFFT